MKKAEKEPLFGNGACLPFAVWHGAVQSVAVNLLSQDCRYDLARKQDFLSHLCCPVIVQCEYFDGSL